MKVLFVCSHGEIRSPTAYDLYKNKWDCWYIGIESNLIFETNFPFDSFDIIIIMEGWMEKYIKTKRLVHNLNIQDIYPVRGHEELVYKLKRRIDNLHIGD